MYDLFESKATYGKMKSISKLLYLHLLNYFYILFGWDSVSISLTIEVIFLCLLSLPLLAGALTQNQSLPFRR